MKRGKEIVMLINPISFISKEEDLMVWPIEYFHYIPASSSFIEMMPGAMKAMSRFLIFTCFPF
jgi:hypothetical protein